MQACILFQHNVQSVWWMYTLWEYQGEIRNTVLGVSKEMVGEASREGFPKDISWSEFWTINKSYPSEEIRWGESFFWAAEWHG